MALSPNPVDLGGSTTHKLQCELPEGDTPWGIGDVFTAAGGLLAAGVVRLDRVKKIKDLNQTEATLVVGSGVGRPNTLQVQVYCGGGFHTLVVNLS